MADKTKAGKGGNVDKSTKKPRVATPRRRRTRLLALEPRVLFDGALAIDVGAKVVQDSLPDTSASEAIASDAAVPTAFASTRDQATSPITTEKSSAAGTGDALDKAQNAADIGKDKATSLDDREGMELDRLLTAEQRTEIIFVDVTVDDYQALINDVGSNVRVVLLDPAKDAIAQISDVTSQYQSGKIDAIHIISHGTEGQINFGSGVLNGITMQSTYAEALSKIGERLSQDADILVYGCDFGSGEVGLQAAAQLASLQR